MSEVILDSGNRREVGNGSVRDVATGKGRFDLTPLNVVGRILNDEDLYVLNPIELYKRSGDTKELINSVRAFIKNEHLNPYDYMIQISQHYERGCAKYGDRNWEIGQPLSWYIDSGTRHYHKYKRGDKDERHDLAYGWNLMSCVWTQEFRPEMIDLPFKDLTVSPAPTETATQIKQDEPIFVEAACGNCRHTRPINGTRYVCLRMGSCRNEVEKSEKPCKYWEANP